MPTHALIDGQQDLAAQERALQFIEQSQFVKVTSYLKSAVGGAGPASNDATLNNVPIGQQPPALHLEDLAVGADASATVAAQTAAGKAEAFRGVCSVQGQDKLVIGFR